MGQALLLIATGLAVMLFSLITVYSGHGQSFPNNVFVIGLVGTVAGVLRAVYLLGVRTRRRERQ